MIFYLCCCLFCLAEEIQSNHSVERDSKSQYGPSFSNKQLLEVTILMKNFIAIIFLPVTVFVKIIFRPNQFLKALKSKYTISGRCEQWQRLFLLMLFIWKFSGRLNKQKISNKTDNDFGKRLDIGFKCGHIIVFMFRGYLPGMVTFLTRTFDRYLAWLINASIDCHESNHCNDWPKCRSHEIR